MNHDTMTPAQAAGVLSHLDPTRNYGPRDEYGIQRWTEHPAGVPLFCQYDPQDTSAAVYPHIASGICDQPALIRVDNPDTASYYFHSLRHAEEWMSYLANERTPYRVVPLGPNGEEHPR